MEEEDDEVDQMAALEAKVQHINRNTVGASSRNAYLRKQIAFVQWLEEHRPDTLDEMFLDEAKAGLDDYGRISRSFIKDTIEAATEGELCPVDFPALEPRDIQMFIASLKKKVCS
jgi:hypothetical protein